MGAIFKIHIDYLIVKGCYIMKKIIKNSTFLLVLGLILGVIFGFLMKLLPSEFYVDDLIMNGVMRFLSTGFISLIKMTVIPLVFVSLICGISSFGDTKKLGSVGLKTVLLFLFSTIGAIIIALIFSIILKPGIGLDLESLSTVDYTPPEVKNIVDIFLDIIPSNPIKSMSKGNLLQVLVFAVFFGVAMGSLGERAKKLIDIFEILNDCMMKIVMAIMKIAPIGIFASISITVYSTGLDSLLGIVKMIGVVALSLVIHSIFIYGGILRFGSKLSVSTFFKKYAKVAGVTFSTASSNAALPASIEMMRTAGVKDFIYQFVLPLGATVNMAGTAIVQGVTAVFIAQAYGKDMGFTSLMMVVISAVLSSIGTAGVPGVGMIMMAMVLESAGLPVQGIALVIGVDRILDMMRTTVNVMGDCVCCLAVAKSEQALDLEKYNS